MSVHFTHPVVSEAQVGKTDKSVARLEPESATFAAVFTARDQLEIRPLKPLPAGETFTLTLYPQALDGVDDGLPPLVSKVTVMRQALRVRVDALAPAGDGQMMLTGHVETADIADPQAVSRVITASQNGAALKTVWQHDGSGHEHSFTVVGIERNADATAVSLRWNGKPLGVQSQGGHDYPVPASPQAFVVTLVRAVSDPEPHVRVQFSQPLLGNQNLAGMVTLNGQPATVRINGSALEVYPKDKIEGGKVALVVNPGIRSARRVRLDDALERTLTLTVTKPGVRFVGDGSILPAGKTLSVPFEAVGAKAVKVQAFEVYENNIPYYLQSHALDSGDVDSSTGRWLWQKTLSLPPGMSEGWQRYRLDLTELMALHPHGLALLKLRLDADTSSYQCPGDKPGSQVTLPDNYEGPGQDDDEDDIDRYYQDAGYLRWSDRDDPCSDAYYAYNDRVEASRGFLASNLGLIAKRGEDQRLLVLASWLDHNSAASGASITVYNYQNQPIGKGTTNEQGEASIAVTGTPFYLLAEQGDQRGYLKLARNLALPTNQFDTGGERVRGGLKGFFYGERDVWRPGDAIHLTFVLGDPNDHLPDDYPVTLDWINPRGEKVASYTSSKPVGGFYAFTLHTAEQAPTGNWRAVARIGKRTFDTLLRVEAIKPNHLKIDLQAPATLSAAQDNAVTLHGQWLNGATAADLKSDVKVRLVNRKAAFAGYDGFVFGDATRKLDAEPFTAFEGQLDDSGEARFQLAVPAIEPAGMASAVLTTRVFENSGDYSTQIRALPVMPYQHWVGIHVPRGSGWGGALGYDQDTGIDLLTLDSDGKPEAGRALTLSVYRIEWRWWWDRGSDDLANFVSDPDTHRLKEVALTSDEKGRVQWTLHGPDYDWGRYLIRVCQDQGRQCAATTVYLGWGGERGAGGDAATRLALSTDKTHYQVGDTAHVEVPASGGGRLLVSLEDGDHILKHYWVAVPAGQDTQRLDIPVTADMAPNVYVDVILLQPHAGRDNDRPIRLYGIAPLLVEDPATRLQPVIKAPQRVRPQQVLPVTISEQQGRPMTYTLAVVDEGLLGLTNFHTPYIHNAFYQREALGVRTWDLYDQVVGAYGGDLDRLLAVGGSDALENGREKQSRRFPPVVRFLGPFQLGKNETQTREVKLPAYMGQVRVMVVAGNGHAYGSADRDVTVTQPLTLLSTLPRVLGPGERLDLPVTVFAAPDAQGKVPGRVTLSAKAEPPLEVTQGETTLHFKQAGDQIGMLSLQVGEGTGTADITVHASAEGFVHAGADGSPDEYRADETVHMPIRAPNPATTEQQGRLLEKGESWQLAVQPHGVAGTNQAWLTVSRLPDMGLQRRLEYLINYPHGCIEQTTSAVFPQLYLDRLIDLSSAEKARIQSNISAAIKRYRRFQLAGGGFSYWPGGSAANDWGSNYAGHFLVEARRLGYAVPSDMLDAWKAFQQRQADNLGSHPWDWSTQAYRLYTLALAGSPQVGAMNRLRELLINEASRQQEEQQSAQRKAQQEGQQRAQRVQVDANYPAARWLLAAAYQRMGLDDVAAELIPDQVSADYHDSWYYTFGSRLRDESIALLVRAQRDGAHDGGSQDANQGVWPLVKQIAGELASSRWYSTQSLSWALMSLAQVGGADASDDGNTQSFAFRWKQDQEDWQPIHSQAALFRQTLERPDSARQLVVRNDSDRRLFVSVTTRGTPPPGGETAARHGLSLSARFVDRAGKPLDPAHLRQGTDFQAIVTVSNLSGQRLEHVALTQILPSGWQITESARAGEQQGDQQDAPLNYRDVRDDRVMTYFNLPRGKSRTYVVSLNASFAGRFYLPGWQVNAMYQGSIYGRSAGQWVEVQRD